MLGTSALMPLPNRGLASAALTCAGRGILFDCGEGTQVQMRKYGVSPVRIDLIALSHYHGDHVFGLPGLMQTMFCLDRKEPLYITGPQGMKEILVPILRLAGKVGYDVCLIEIPKNGLKMNTLNAAWPEGALLTAYPTFHRVPSQAYTLELSRPGAFLPENAKALDIPVRLWSTLQKGTPVDVNGRTVFPSEVLTAPRKGLKFCFSGDTGFCRSLIKAAKNADLLISEATYGDDEQQQMANERGHMTFSDAARTARDAGAARLWLTHYSQMVASPEENRENAARYFPNVECCTDGQTLTLNFDER